MYRLPWVTDATELPIVAYQGTVLCNYLTRIVLGQFLTYANRYIGLQSYIGLANLI